MRTFITIMAFMGIVISTNAFSMDLEFKPIVAVGNRFGSGDINNKGAFYATAKMTTLKVEVDDFKTINFLSLGLNYQDDRKWATSISPISISSLSGITIGVDYIPKTKDVNGGTIGAFIGIKIP